MKLHYVCFCYYKGKDNENPEEADDDDCVILGNMTTRDKSSITVLTDVLQLAAQCMTADELIKKMGLSAEQITALERETVGQANNKLWLEARKGRITASNFYRIFTKIETVKRKVDTDCEKLTMSFLKPTDISHLPQIAHGVKFEASAIKKACEQLGDNHQNITYKKCGLFLHSAKPYLGASPDGIITCSCCDSPALLEVKCPSLPLESLSYLKNDRLKHKSNYYAQIQGQMMVTKILKTYFCVYTKERTIIQPILFDEIFAQKLVKNLDYYFYHYLAPALLNEPVTKKRKL